MKRTDWLKLSLVTTLTLIGGHGMARAFPDYLKSYANDPQSRPELRAKCAVCHINPQGGGARNSFGTAFKAAGLRITPELRASFPDLFSLSPQSPQVKFIDGSDAEAVVTIDGRQYVINTRTRTVRELNEKIPNQMAVSAPQTKEPVSAPASSGIYQSNEQRLVNLPTAAPIAAGSLWTDFTHRFPFGKPTNASGLFGLDAQALPSLGAIYGLTDVFHIGIYRSPGDLGRPIQLLAGARLLGEERGHPISATARFGIEGRDNFQRHFARSVEVAIARSLTRHAQLYVVPTITFGDRPFNADLTAEIDGRTSVALGLGGAFRVRPSLNLLAEANYRLNQNSRYYDLGAGIRRPVVGFGIQKESASRRHAFTLTFTNGPGTTMSQRSQTRGLYFADDGLRGLTIGFNLSRRFFK
ncbi:MAG: DUF5777 family beta-barrel protein [Acidobacteriota bacterium]